MSLPDEIQQLILEFIEPYVTRKDWRTCRQKEARGIQCLVHAYEKGKPRNNSHPVLYRHWTFYERLRFGKLESDHKMLILPRLRFCFEMRKIPYFF
jgi:hypothetical protein